MTARNQAIDNLYSAFANVPKPAHIEGCPCCIEHKQIPNLLRSPLREIAPAELASYAASALLTVGEVADYLYFLPRIIEVSLTDDSWCPDIEVTAKAIRATDFKQWPALRQEALLAVLDSQFSHLLETQAYWELDGWLCASALLGLDVRRYLQKIEANSDAVLHYFDDNVRSLNSGKLCNAFWELPNAGYDQILQWFHSPTIRRIPSAAYGYQWSMEVKPDDNLESLK